MKFPSSNAISAGHQVTLESARNILQDGGNAVDAAVAAFATACIAEPCMASAGAGGFAMVYMNQQDPVLVDFFCQTPLSNDQNRALDFLEIPVDFGEAQEIYYGGLASMAVPGSVAGLFALNERWGSRPMPLLFDQAIEHAVNGVPINEFQFHDLSLLTSVFDFYPRGQELFKPDQELIQVGKVLKLPRFADFLDFLGKEGKDAFYKGEVAQKLIKDCEEKGGFLSSRDLESYSIEFRKPLHSRLGPLQIFSNPLPSIGGSLMSIGLGSVETSANFSEMVIPAFLRMESFQKDPEKISQFQGRNRRGATSHFNILDRWGNGVALTMTIGEGSGYFIPGTDIHMNNMLGESSLVPQGWHTWKPNVRLSSMMSPVIVFQEKKLRFMAGSGGASRIPGAIMQTLYHSLVDKLDLRSAVDFPRCHLENKQIDLEPDLEIDFRKLPDGYERSQWSKKSMFFGGVHAIEISEKGIFAAGDTRRDGVGWVS